MTSELPPREEVSVTVKNDSFFKENKKSVTKEAKNPKREKKRKKEKKREKEKEFLHFLQNRGPDSFRNSSLREGHLHKFDNKNLYKFDIERETPRSLKEREENEK